jgi:type I restriction enzyme S subunit
VGKLAIASRPICTSQDFTNYSPYYDNVIFLAYYIKSNKNALLSFNQGTSIRGFTKDNLTTLQISIPGKPEQQKIADCLSSLDELITAQGQKIEALKAHKKGLMQGLFPSADEGGS